MPLDDEIKEDLTTDAVSAQDTIIGVVFLVLFIIIIILFLINYFGLTNYFGHPTYWRDNSVYKAFIALIINYIFVFLITFGGQSLAPNLPEFDKVGNQTEKNAKNSALWSLIFQLSHLHYHRLLYLIYYFSDHICHVVHSLYYQCFHPKNIYNI